MKLADLSPAERDSLADLVGCSRKYLYQVATGAIDFKTGRARQPGTDLCRQLVNAEPRLTLAELRPDVWGEPLAAAKKVGLMPTKTPA